MRAILFSSFALFLAICSARAAEELLPPFGFHRTIEWYNQRMGEIRRYFDAKFGTGKLVSRSRDSDTEVIQTLVGYQWMVGATMLELFYFSAQHDDLVFRTISVDYKAL